MLESLKDIQLIDNEEMKEQYYALLEQKNLLEKYSESTEDWYGLE
jgi:hypothetical protein